ncbi:Ubiquitin carboxyl-terminal hydrolase 37 [Lunasporangiospora selenospora]|uniref:Ubiquitin carboxyl-terminal hydrolase 37 n=1 Tax=Lunasporangiospora selenospora TaxID=979761 RepID=A0A9P6FZU1_9FUNG|nr:Ubiquitin carboxyl-terminal hydrolase 37 [Lunasporangiospora selenospora]
MDDFRRRSRIASTIGFDGLYRSLTHSFSQCSENRLMKLEDYETVVERVVKIGKGSLGDDEDDAREFLGDLLNQLRKEDRETMDQKCPLSHLFECAIDNFLRCPNCGHESVHTEQHHDLRLEVPSQDINRSSQRPLSIGSLILEVFDAQQIFYECESCQYQSAEVHRTVSKLPTVLVLYLKRFTPRPTQRSRKNRSLVSIDGLLDVGLFCTPTALSLTAQEDLISLSQSMDEERMNLHPQIPSDSFPSSSSSRFSSVSPRKRMDSLSTDGFGVGSLLYDSFESTYSNPIELYSEDENLYDPTPEQSFSVYESTCEEEQIRWAIEESIRASQSSLNAVDDSWIEQSLDEAASSPHAYTNSGSLIFNGMSHDDEDSNGFHVENHNAINTNGKETAYDKEENGDSAPYEILSSQESVTVKTEEQLTAPVASTARSPIVIEDDEDDEDPELKAAILASLNPKEASVETTTATEKDLLEQENRDIEEAIKRSLVDLEENKENISPDEPKDGKKKGKHGKKPSVGTLTRSHSQIYSLSQPTSTATLSISTTKTEPTIPRLIRAHTIEGEGSWRYELRSKTRTGVEPAMIDHPIRSTSSPTPPRTPTTKLAGIPSRPESKTRVPPPSPIELQRHRSTTKPGLATTPTTSTTAAATTSKPGRMTRSQKGKEKAWIEQETADEKLGHFRLQATVSHTGLVSPTPGDRGRYVCDSLGPDGVWRSHDENGVMSKIGSLADLCQKRGRSGYMFFYVRTQTTTTAAGL